MSRERVVIKFEDADNKRKWKELCNKIDHNADYEEIVEMLFTYLEEKAKYDAVVKATEGPEFR